MLDIFKEYRELINNYILQYLDEQHKQIHEINRWADDGPARLKPFVTSGKLIRGGLALLAAEMYGQDRVQALPIGASMEFFQSAFLIHDDIMDMDEYRRGERSLYAQYREIVKTQGIREDLRAGQSLGICLGDVSFFWAYDLLNRLECDGQVRRQILSTASSEYVKVGLAQMEDVYFGFYPGEVKREEILNVFRYKTARYTFSLPLMMGATFARASKEQLAVLSRLGEHLGILFQIKDDELGIFSDNAQLGKVVGSDLSENKKTLHRLLLFEKANPEENERLGQIFGKEPITESDLGYVRNLIKEKGIDREIDGILQDLVNKSEDEIQHLDIRQEYKDILHGLVEYSMGRKF